MGYCNRDVFAALQQRCCLGRIRRDCVCSSELLCHRKRVPAGPDRRVWDQPLEEHPIALQLNRVWNDNLLSIEDLIPDDRDRAVIVLVLVRLDAVIWLCLRFNCSFDRRR